MKTDPSEWAKEWGTAVLLAIVTALILFVPYYLGAEFAAQDRVFTGIIMNPEDSQTYFAKMQQGFEGHWLYTIPFTPEAHEGTFVGGFYLVLGQLARFLGLSLTTMWHTARLGADVILFVTIFGFISAFIQDRRTRWTAYLLALFGSGLGWLLFILGNTYWLDAFPVDFKQPGAHIFFTAMTFPHITMGTACILVSMCGLKQLTIDSQQRTVNSQQRTVNSQQKTVNSQRNNSQFTIHNSLFIITLANFSNLFLGIAYPFLLYLIIGTAVLYWLILSIQSRTILWKQAALFAATCILPAPLYIYFAAILQTNAVFATWDAQAVTPSAPWPHYLVAFGPYLLLAGLLWWKRPSARQQYAILWCWLLVVALLLYAPLNPQRRFLQGVHVPLSFLAVLGLIDVILPRLVQSRGWQRIAALPRYETPKMIRLLLLLFLLGMSLSNIYLWADVVRTAVIIQPDPLFRPADEANAAQWLHDNVSTSAIILGDMQTGSLVAARSGQRVMLGHWAETVDYEQKEALVAQFFAEETPDSWRKDQIAHYHINYVWHGPREKRLGAFDPALTTYLEPVFNNATITIYEVMP